MICSVLNAQYYFSGRVVDNEEAPLIGASVTYGESFASGAVTDVDGSFNFTAGRAKVKLAMSGLSRPCSSVSVLPPIKPSMACWR